MKSDKPVIIFTAGGSPGMEALYRDMSDKYDLYFADMNPERISPTIPRHRRVQIPAAMAPNFVSEMKRICTALEANLLVPGVDEELPLLWADWDEQEQTTLFLPKASFVLTMLDKLEMNQAFAAEGLSVPTTVRGDESFDHLTFPVIVKPRKGRGSRDVHVVKDPHKLRSFLNFLEGAASTWLIQEMIKGDEYTVQIVSDQGSSLLGVLPIFAAEKRGSTTVAEVRYDPAIEEYCRKVHDAFSPHGTYNIQLIKTAAGSIHSFEVNPRISTTFCMAMKLGYDPFDHFINGGSTNYIPLPKRSLRLIRHWTNEFIED